MKVLSIIIPIAFCLLFYNEIRCQDSLKVNPNVLIKASFGGASNFGDNYTQNKSSDFLIKNLGSYLYTDLSFTIALPNRWNLESIVRVNIPTKQGGSSSEVYLNSLQEELGSENGYFIRSSSLSEDDFKSKIHAGGMYFGASYSIKSGRKLTIQPKMLFGFSILKINSLTLSTFKEKGSHNVFLIEEESNDKWNSPRRFTWMPSISFAHKMSENLSFYTDFGFSVLDTSLKYSKKTTNLFTSSSTTQTVSYSGGLSSLNIGFGISYNLGWF